MFTEVRDLQPEKALLPIVVTLFGMVTEVSALQPAKAAPPIAVTLFGMFTEVRELQSLKASCPIVVTPSPIIIRLISDLLHGPPSGYE